MAAASLSRGVGISRSQSKARVSTVVDSGPTAMCMEPEHKSQQASASSPFVGATSAAASAQPSSAIVSKPITEEQLKATFLPSPVEVADWMYRHSHKIRDWIMPQETYKRIKHATSAEGIHQARAEFMAGDHSEAHAGAKRHRGHGHAPHHVFHAPINAREGSFGYVERTYYSNWNQYSNVNAAQTAQQQWSFQWDVGVNSGVPIIRGGTPTAGTPLTEQNLTATNPWVQAQVDNDYFSLVYSKIQLLEIGWEILTPCGDIEAIGAGTGTAAWDPGLVKCAPYSGAPSQYITTSGQPVAGSDQAQAIIANFNHKHTISFPFFSDRKRRPFNVGITPITPVLLEDQTGTTDPTVVYERTKALDTPAFLAGTQSFCAYGGQWLWYMPMGYNMTNSICHMAMRWAIKIRWHTLLPPLDITPTVDVKLLHAYRIKAYQQAIADRLTIAAATASSVREATESSSTLVRTNSPEPESDYVDLSKALKKQKL